METAALARCWCFRSAAMLRLPPHTGSGGGGTAARRRPRAAADRCRRAGAAGAGRAPWLSGAPRRLPFSPQLSRAAMVHAASCRRASARALAGWQHTRAATASQQASIGLRRLRRQECRLDTPFCSSCAAAAPLARPAARSACCRCAIRRGWCWSIHRRDRRALAGKRLRRGSRLARCARRGARAAALGAHAMTSPPPSRARCLSVRHSAASHAIARSRPHHATTSGRQPVRRRRRSAKAHIALFAPLEAMHANATHAQMDVRSVGATGQQRVPGAMASSGTDLMATFSLPLEDMPWRAGSGRCGLAVLMEEKVRMKGCARREEDERLGVGTTRKLDAENGAAHRAQPCVISR